MNPAFVHCNDFVQKIIRVRSGQLQNNSKVDNKCQRGIRFFPFSITCYTIFYKLEDSKGNLMKVAGTTMKTLAVMTFKKFY
jgi:hypothetical protein